MKLGMVSVHTLPSVAEQHSTEREGATPFFFRRSDTDEGGTLDPNMLMREHSGGIELMPIVHPDRQRPKFNFAKAGRHFSNIFKDKEQTDELIGIFDALPWRSVGEAASAFLASEHGRAIYQSEPHLSEIFDDHVTLRRTPKGSFAHAYCDFMEREGLTAAGMVEASGNDRNGLPLLADGVEWYGDRLRDTHDILHILTGYGRDPLGEQCVLAYLFHQRPSPGHLAVSWAATLLMKLKGKTQAPILRAVAEAHRHGRLCPRIVEQPIRELLQMPLDTVRERLSVHEPIWYRAVHDVWRAEGRDPHAFFAKQDG
jgi:ubiquinone biosynthesis protein COQ4